ncbi:MAG: GNAT family N-acetyltransferase [Candidatus Thorarchaeota archaeon]|jgi:ribosomal protein S18 acetylase RimI-like enzyme
MIQIEIDKVSSDDYQALARMTIDARKGSILESTRSMEERIANIKTLSENDAFRILVARDDQGVIVGWTYYYIAFRLMTFISGFYPIVAKTDDADRIALSLLEAGKKEILERKHTRLELEIELLTEAHRTLSAKWVDWYKKAGFVLATEVPNGYILRKFSEVPMERLIESGNEIFSDSMEDLFRSMSHPEQKVNLEYWFDKSTPFHDDASLVLKQDEKIIGFVITKPMGEKVEIGPVGLIREARGQGLGSILLGTVLRVLRDEKVKTAALDTSRNNSISRSLYDKFGFKEVYYKQFYYWSP